jgi:hypothetical protein
MAIPLTSRTENNTNLPNVVFKGIFEKDNTKAVIINDTIIAEITKNNPLGFCLILKNLSPINTPKTDNM